MLDRFSFVRRGQKMLTVATAKKRIRAISATWVFGDMGSPSSPSLRDYPRRISSQPRGASRHDPVARLVPGQGIASYGGVGDDGVVKAAYRGGCPACQNLPKERYAHEH